MKINKKYKTKKIEQMVTNTKSHNNDNNLNRNTNLSLNFIYYHYSTIRNRILRYGKRLRLLFWHEVMSSTKSTSQRIICLVLLFSLLFTILLATFTLLVWFKISNNIIHVNHLVDSPQQIRNNESHESIGKVFKNKINNAHDLELQQQQSLSMLGMIYNESDRMKKEIGYNQHAFNTLISERIGQSRLIPDTRNELCRNQSYSEASLAHLTTSVIICFYNEDFNTLQRTIYTVLERTPDALLQEIILIDDHSDSE